MQSADQTPLLLRQEAAAQICLPLRRNLARSVKRSSGFHHYPNRRICHSDYERRCPCDQFSEYRNSIESRLFVQPRSKRTEIMQTVKIFVSHATGESELAKLLQEQIEADFIGLIKVFVASDGASIVVGDNWLKDIVSELGSADIYVALCSQDSVDRPWINIELGAALARGKTVIPVYHTDLTVEKFQRRPLSDYEGFNAHDPEGLRSLYSRLQQALGSRLPVVDFDSLASKVRAFESRYLRQKETISASATTPGLSHVSRQLPILALSAFRAISFKS